MAVMPTSSGSGGDAEEGTFSILRAGWDVIVGAIVLLLAVKVCAMSLVGKMDGSPLKMAAITFTRFDWLSGAPVTEPLNFDWLRGFALDGGFPASLGWGEFVLDLLTPGV